MWTRAACSVLNLIAKRSCSNQYVTAHELNAPTSSSGYLDVREYGVFILPLVPGIYYNMLENFRSFKESLHTHPQNSLPATTTRTRNGSK
jgi:hypothetical protein